MNNIEIAEFIFNDPVLIKDLHSSNDKLSFEQFLIKHMIKKNELPEIKELVISASNSNNLRYSDENSTFHKFFANEKLLRLFNLQSTVEHITICPPRELNFNDVCVETCVIGLGKVHFDNVCDIEIVATDVVHNFTNKYWKQEKIYKDSLVNILLICLRNFSKLESFGMDWSNKFPGTLPCEYTIDINDSDEISNKNKFESILKLKVVNACLECFETNNKKNIDSFHYCPWDVFCFRRHYQV